MPNKPQKSISDYIEQYSKRENEADRKRKAAKEVESSKTMEVTSLNNVVEFIIKKSER
jgi:hypothetical protein